jgi:hypothetical protein
VGESTTHRHASSVGPIARVIQCPCACQPAVCKQYHIDTRTLDFGSLGTTHLGVGRLWPSSPSDTPSTLSTYQPSITPLQPPWLHPPMISYSLHHSVPALKIHMTPLRSPGSISWLDHSLPCSNWPKITSWVTWKLHFLKYMSFPVYVEGSLLDKAIGHGNFWDRGQSKTVQTKGLSGIIIWLDYYRWYERVFST